MFILDFKARQLLLSEKISDSLAFPLTSMGRGARPEKISCKKPNLYPVNPTDIKGINYKSQK